MSMTYLHHQAQRVPGLLPRNAPRDTLSASSTTMMKMRRMSTTAKKRRSRERPTAKKRKPTEQNLTNSKIFFRGLTMTDGTIRLHTPDRVTECYDEGISNRGYLNINRNSSPSCKIL